jgi:hypothetical protein
MVTVLWIGTSGAAGRISVRMPSPHCRRCRACDERHEPQQERIVAFLLEGHKDHRRHWVIESPLPEVRDRSLPK